VVAAAMAEKLIKMVAQVEPEEAATAAAQTIHIPELLARPTQAVAAAVVASLNLLLPQLLENQAVPASSSSNTTSALPRSLPSNPRRTGLHRLVRSALTTSLLRVVAVVVALEQAKEMLAAVALVDSAPELH